MALFSLQQLWQVVRRSVSRSADSKQPPNRRFDFGINALEHPRATVSTERYWLWESLTRREKEVARLIATGKRNTDIARDLYISPYTVKTHVQHIHEKLKTNSRIELAFLVRDISDQPQDRDWSETPRDQKAK